MGRQHTNVTQGLDIVLELVPVVFGVEGLLLIRRLEEVCVLRLAQRDNHWQHAGGAERTLVQARRAGGFVPDAGKSALSL